MAGGTGRQGVVRRASDGRRRRWLELQGAGAGKGASATAGDRAWRKHSAPPKSKDALKRCGAAGWTVAADGCSIVKSYRLAGFPLAMAFMALVAPVAEAADHHPEWRNVYNRVEVTLTTHDAGGVTDKDLALAAHMEDVWAMLEKSG